MEVTQVTVDMQALKAKWGWFLGLGVVITLIGMAALAFPWIATWATVLMFGYFLIISGISQTFFSFQMREWQGVAINLVSGVLELIVGLIVVLKPGQAAAVLTLVLAMYLLVGGAFRIGAAFTMRVPGAGWLALSGVVSLLCGLFLISEWPTDAIWFIGTCVGIDLVFHGFAWTVLGLSLRRK